MACSMQITYRCEFDLVHGRPNNVFVSSTYSANGSTNPFLRTDFRNAGNIFALDRKTKLMRDGLKRNGTLKNYQSSRENICRLLYIFCSRHEEMCRQLESKREP